MRRRRAKAAARQLLGRKLQDGTAWSTEDRVDQDDRYRRLQQRHQSHILAGVHQLDPGGDTALA